MTDISIPLKKIPVVLVVEDDWVVRTLIHEILETEGFHVVTSETADDAWRYLQEHLGEIDLVFSDIHMPGSIDGIDLANLVHRHWPQMPIILSSGIPGRRPLDHGCEPIFVSKPWHSRDIGMICQRALAGPTARVR
jgi:CheY-like chemotaxis protein